MSVKANWHNSTSFTMPSGDPFADVAPRPIEPPRLRGRVVLEDLVADQLRQEGQLFARDVTCPIKHRPDTTCSACPLRGHHPAMRPLCDLGCEQERALTELALVIADGFGAAD